MLILPTVRIEAGNRGTSVAVVGNAGCTFPEPAASPASLRLGSGSGIPLFSIQPPPAQKPTFVTPRCLPRSKWVKWGIAAWRPWHAKTWIPAVALAGTLPPCRESPFSPSPAESPGHRHAGRQIHATSDISLRKSQQMSHHQRKAPRTRKGNLRCQAHPPTASPRNHSRNRLQKWCLTGVPCRTHRCPACGMSSKHPCTCSPMSQQNGIRQVREQARTGCRTICPRRPCAEIQAQRWK